MQPTGYPDLDALLPRLAALPGLDAPALAAERIAILGRKQGALTAALKALPGLAGPERKRFGAEANRLKQAFEAALEAREAELGAAEGSAPAAELDLTMPGRGRWIGALHPVTRVLDEMVAVFRELGFAVAVGPEAETEWYNFGALNFPPDHPTMDLHDTLYLTGEGADRVLLRTHTSPVQIRVMQAGPPPYRVVAPGMVYRNDTWDASHAPAFLQLEGLAVDEGIGFVDLKATLTRFAQRIFTSATKVRFRPSYFPFTEPSAELDVECQICHGGGCPACKQTGWMELSGCGMVHPKVLETCGVDAERFTGWAFGMGPGRTAQQRFGIPDIRLEYGGDMRFLRRLAGEGFP
ncbi:MAG TPA: phenylalanine--tRNA ligase subunit alpha [Gemmatimonadales bacterium]|jgi:phenylalanyl-tRNA synthetase alpha chain|nr:phenylalanine--tRNA ligase subunit alpha [Gemmatimonadales bacterium]